MALTTKPLNQIVTAVRGTASTYTAADGVIKGVAFSITPNTIGTGSRTFLLQGGTGQNLGFAVGQNVRAMDAGAGTADMQGTVTSYNSSTQTLVINVTTTTGSGSFSNWRIGQLDLLINYDENTLVNEGLLSQGSFTNLLQYSRQLENAYWSRTAGGTGVVPTLQPNAALAPDGSFSAARLVLNKGAGATTTDAANLISSSYSRTIGLPYTAKVWIRSANSTSYTLRLETDNGNAGQTKAGVNTGNIVVTPQWQSFESASYATAATASFYLRLRGGTGTSDFADVYIWQPQVTQSFFCNTDIPSATAFTSRASGGTRFNRSGVLSGFDTSTTSNTVGTGPRTFTLGATANVDRGYIVGETLVRAEQTGTPANFVQGLVTAYNPATQSLTIEVTTTGGTGTIASWSLTDRGARFTYNPANLAHGPNLQLEPAATNLLTFSEDFTNAAWPRIRAQIEGNVTLAPDGQTNGDRLVIDTTPATNHNIAQSFNSVAGTTYTWSVFAKASEIVGINLRFSNANFPAGSASFNLLNQQILNVGSVVNSAISNAGNGWYRCLFTSTAVASGAVSAQIFLTTPEGSITIPTANGTDGVFIWGAQLEATNSITSYIPTTTAQVTRAADASTSIATTRNADNARIIGTNFSDTFNPAAGTYIFTARPDAMASGTALSANDATTNNSLRISQRSYPLMTFSKGVTNGTVDLIGTNAQGAAMLRNDGVSMTSRFSGEAATINQVAYDGVSKFLSTGAAETIIETASDGVANTVRSINTLHQGAYYGGPANLFVVAGAAGRLSISPDGLAWERIQTPETANQFNEITSSASTYVAVGSGGVIHTSTDARTWTPRSSGVSQSLTGVTYSGTLFAAARLSTAQNILTSPDGVTWTAQTTAANQLQRDVHFANGLFVSVGDGGTIQTSTNGTTWTSATSNTTNILLGVTYDAASGLWVAVGAAGTVVYSTTPATTWTNGTANTGTTQVLNEVLFFGGLFVTVGNTQTIITNSAANIQAGGTWTSRTANVSANLNGIATNGTSLVVTGTANAITTSPDGITWTSRTGNGNTMNGVAYGANTWVVCGNPQGGSGVIATVSNSGVYQRRVSNTTQTIRAGIFAGGRFVFGADGGVIVTSTDGITWTAVTVGGITTSFNHVAYNGSLYVAMGTSGRFSTSTDGLTWTAAANSASGSAMNGLAFDQGIFVAVGSSGATQTSANGTTWTARASGTTAVLTGVHYSTRDGVWYAYGTNTILRSPDAMTWTDAQGDALGVVLNGSAMQANPVAGKFALNTFSKIALTYDANSVSISVNGGPVVTRTGITMPNVLQQLSIGSNGLTQDFFNGQIRNLQYRPTRTADSDLPALSA